MLSKPVNVAIDPSLNENLTVEKDDLVLVGLPKFDGLVGVGLVRSIQASTKKLDEKDAFVMAKVTWPSKSVRKILASFKLNHLRIEENMDEEFN